MSSHKYSLFQEEFPLIYSELSNEESSVQRLSFVGLEGQMFGEPNIGGIFERDERISDYQEDQGIYKDEYKIIEKCNIGNAKTQVSTGPLETEPLKHEPERRYPLFLLKFFVPGRVPQELHDVVCTTGKYHSKLTKDNIFRKIKVKYHNFLLEFLNKLIENKFHSNFSNLKIKKLNSKITQDISISFNRMLFEQKLWEFFSSSISDKYKKISYNLRNLLYIMDKNKDIKKILEMTYIEAYNELFVNANKEIIPKEFVGILSKCMHLEKLIEKMKLDKSKNPINYIKEFEVCTKKEFLSYFTDKKPRKKRKDKNYELIPKN